jgi:hypothetical protein
VLLSMSVLNSLHTDCSQAVFTGPLGFF